MSSRKSLDFEINLLPVISLMAVIITFLLVTAVWVPLGSLDVKQSVGGNVSTSNNKDKHSLWVKFENNGLSVFLRNEAMQVVGKSKLFNSGDLTQFNSYVESTIAEHPSINNVIIAPQKSTSFKELVVIMDEFKKQASLNLGIAPL